MLSKVLYAVGTLVSPIEGLKPTPWLGRFTIVFNVGTLVSPIEGLKLLPLCGLPRRRKVGTLVSPIEGLKPHPTGQRQ